MREHKSLTPSSNSSSGREWSHKRRTRSPRGNVHGAPSHSVRGERHPYRRNRTLPLGNIGSDAMSRALRQISRLQFSGYIEDVKLPRCFTQPTFTIYNGETDLVEHVSHFNQRMAIHSINEALIC